MSSRAAALARQAAAGVPTPWPGSVADRSRNQPQPWALALMARFARALVRQGSARAPLGSVIGRGVNVCVSGRAAAVMPPSAHGRPAVDCDRQRRPCPAEQPVKAAVHALPCMMRLWLGCCTSTARPLQRPRSPQAHLVRACVHCQHPGSPGRPQQWHVGVSARLLLQLLLGRLACSWYDWLA